MESLSGLELAYCAAVLLVGYGLRGSTGFGGAIGMPLLALVLPIKVLVPAWTLLGITSSITIVARDRTRVSMSALIAFLPGCFVGIAIGLALFDALDARALTRSLGVFVLAYATYTLWLTLRPATKVRLSARVLAPLGSTLSGVVGALFGAMATLFFVVYLDTRNLAKEAFRATISAMLLTLSITRGIGYYLVGEFTRDSLFVFAAAFPIMLIGIAIGDRIHVRLSEITFRRVIVATLVLAGIPLVLR
jgi:hypothetical protein